MTYKEIIDIFKEKTTGHFFLNEFGYGDISDISTPDDGKSPMYPYVFLNPIAVNGGEQISTFNFNLICMTQTQDDEQSIIDAQSNSIDYLRDLISSVNYSITNPLVEFQEPFNFTPFKERFQDDVVGATVNMSVVYPTTLDLCKAPIAAPEDCLLFNTLTGDRNEGDTIFNTTFEFGGWGYLNANERNDYSGYTFTFECDTTYGYYIAKEGVDFTNSQGNSSDNNYPLLIYVKNSVNPAETGWWGTTVPSLPLNCGNQFPYTDHSQGLKIPVFNNNGWIYPTEGWAYSNRLGYNYLFSTNCNDPKPIPTAAPLPPPSPTPTPTSTVTPTVTPTATVTPSPVPESPTPTPTSTVTPTVTPTTTVTPTNSVTPTQSVTPTITPTSTVTPTQSVTATPTITPTTTITPTPSITVTPSITATPSVTATPSITPTITPTSTITPTPTPTPSVETCHIEAQNGDFIIAQNGDYIDHFPCFDPSPTPTPSITPTNTVTPTPSSSVPSGDADATAYLAAVVTAGGTTNATIDAAVDALFVELKAIGVYNELDAFYPAVGGTAASHAINANLNTSYDLTFNGGWTHNVSGMTSNGSNAYADTNVTPQDLGGVGTGLDRHHMLSSHAGVTSLGYEGVGPSPYMAQRHGFIQWLDAQSSITPGATYGTGVPAIQIGNRTANNSTNIQWMVTGGTIGKSTNTNTATSISTNNIEIGRISNTSFYVGKLTNFWSLGDGLTDTEVSDYFDAINTFNNSLGRRDW